MLDKITTFFISAEIKSTIIPWFQNQLVMRKKCEAKLYNKEPKKMHIIVIWGKEIFCR